MLKHTLLHIPGIGPKTELRLWEQGITDIYMLNNFQDEQYYEEAPNRAQQKMTTTLQNSISAWEQNNWNFFLENLPSSQHWRILSSFKRPAYIDIETTGLGFYNNHITTIALFDGESAHIYIYGRNLDDFRTDIMKYDGIITYNGKTFDIPFINRQFGITLPHPHLDLRYPLAHYGYKGGLKAIEPQLNITRPNMLHDVDGFTAVLLWNEYALHGNRSALETLVAYNIEDVINLCPLAVRLYNTCLPDIFSHLQLPEDIPRPEIPYRIDSELIQRLQRT